MADEFVNYAFQDLPRKKIKKYAAQYEDTRAEALHFVEYQTGA